MKYIDLHCDTLCMAFATQDDNVYNRTAYY